MSRDEEDKNSVTTENRTPSLGQTPSMSVTPSNSANVRHTELHGHWRSLTDINGLRSKPELTASPDGVVTEAGALSYTAAMKKTDALKLFAGGVTEMAKKCGVTPGAISKAPEELPASLAAAVIATEALYGVKIPKRMLTEERASWDRLSREQASAIISTAVLYGAKIPVKTLEQERSRLAQLAKRSTFYKPKGGVEGGKK